MPQSTPTDQDYCASQLRTLDRERYLIALTAGKKHRDALLALLAFNVELAQSTLVVSDPMLGMIRLAWWREVLDEIYGNTEVRKHPVALALAQAVRTHSIPRTMLEPMIDARSLDLEALPFAEATDMLSYCRQTSGQLMQAAMQLLGTPHEAAMPLGTAWGLLGQVRSLGFHAARGRCIMPETTLKAHGLDTDISHWAHHPQELGQATADILHMVREELQQAQGTLPPMLHAMRIACEHYLKILTRHQANILRLPTSTGRAGLAFKLLLR